MAEECKKKENCWLVKMIAGVMVAGVFLNGWAAVASSDTDSKQDSRIKAVEINQTYVKEQLSEQNKKLDRLLELSTNMNLDLKTHIARSDGN